MNVIKKLVSEKAAAYGILAILSPMIIFHLLVISGVIPFTIVWGGRLTNREEMLQFESISIAVLLLVLLLVAVKAGIVRMKTNPLFFKVVFWMLAGLFLVNTLGNLQAIKPIERFTFTPITFLLSILCVRLALTTSQSK